MDGGDHKEDDEMGPPPSLTHKAQVEKAEENKLKAKFPKVNRSGGGGHSAFLQKRLAKGQKYFDSGDYQMAKQSQKGGTRRYPASVPVLAQPSTGETIPTPESVPARKTSIIQPLHDHSQSMHLPSDPAHHSPAPGQPLPNPALRNLAS
uniref:cAMP-regulated phosphoprotein 19 n=1 Tax=Caligus rogercresseyi TaxID=217165 RepID=C1BPD0_CALRO|nr:cAMP-regulated phosphoprotein 19 [Caligus rogercresseyi]|eukprot:TRINITY_DN1581_c0_g2_i1.p1 TRINITY_DN1581_c0_g2~~TRINITY_DN1581_c0_g2_i1.p1  ORF type:complete len:149 (-),score=54.60 TRINITY_DN1581_c0_g2_i1:417-863(-)